MYGGLKRCEQNHPTCLMWRDGRCIGLNSTDFPYHCPFYKERLKMSIEELDAYNEGVRNGFQKQDKGTSAADINGKAGMGKNGKS